VSIAIMFTQATQTANFPGGATALIAVIGTPRIKELGFGDVIFPVLRGVILMLAVAYLSARLAGKSGCAFVARLRRVL
jgi:CBS-domain-containing membrane protein